MRWLMGGIGIALAACAAEPPPEPVVASTAPLELEPEPAPLTAESRPVPMRFETRRIGVATDDEGGGWRGAPVDIDVKDADLHDVIRLLADVGHANIVVADDVSGRVTMKLKHVPWDQALDVVARSKGLGIERDGAVIVVTGR